jgi:S-adenosylmethionine:tRNA ribosyltransferase-isomerase
MLLSDFDFDLPDALIAQTPPINRGESRLLQVTQDGGLKDSLFPQVLELICPGDALVMNNTKVIPARLFGKKASGGKLELLVERLLSSHELLAQIKASHKPKEGQAFDLVDAQGSTYPLIVSRYQAPFVVLRADPSGPSVLNLLERFGEIPLPPYIERKPEKTDNSRYQTVYAKTEGAVAAPTAGLHFTNSILDALAAKGVELVYLTLHVGAGTFQPVRVENLSEHKMHSEWFELSFEAAQTINRVKAQGGKVIAVGTTSLRALESAAAIESTVRATSTDTDIFITPGYEFKVVDHLITNFHLPKSTLMMLVSAFSGHREIMQAYQHAIAQQYRFFSYGDAMWLQGKPKKQ